MEESALSVQRVYVSSPLTPILFASLIGFFLAPKAPLIASQLKSQREAVSD